MKRLGFLLLLGAMLFGSIANAETINTYNGVITVTPGTVAYGEVGTLLNAAQMNGVGIGGAYWNPAGSPTVQVAGSTLDHYWVQSSNNEIIWSLTTPVSAVLGFAGTDHGPLPQENLEYKMWGSDDLQNWFVGTLTAIYREGWEPSADYTLPGGWKDEYATRWDFGQNYSYFKTVGTPGVVVGWSDYDPEMDGIAAVASSVPEPSAMLLLGSGLVGLVGYGRRRFRK